MRNYIKFGGKQAENHVLLIASLSLVDLICLRGQSITRLGLALGVVYRQSVGGVQAKCGWCTGKVGWCTARGYLFIRLRVTCLRIILRTR